MATSGEDDLFVLLVVLLMLSLLHLIYLWLWCFSFQDNKDNAAVNKIMKELDANGDGQVDFQEFVILVVSAAVACTNFYEHLDKLCQEKGIPEED